MREGVAEPKPEVELRQCASCGEAGERGQTLAAVVASEKESVLRPMANGLIARLAALLSMASSSSVTYAANAEH